MKNFEEIDSADRRKKQAEDKDELSLSHWRGELHSHTKKDISEPLLPEDISENREGSNCGKIPLEVLVAYNAQEMKNSILAITEHSRDASPQKAVEGMTSWFLNMYLDNDAWLNQEFGHGAQDLSEEEHLIIRELAKKQAEEVAYYGDERLESILAQIDGQVPDKNIRVLKGVEANLLPSGDFDTDMVDEDKFELVNTSIHPDLDPDGFETIIQDSESYSQLVVKGIKQPKTNIMAHIGEGVDRAVTSKLDWTDILQAAFENKVAIEINLKKVMRFIEVDLMDYEKFPKSDSSWRGVLEEKLAELVPIISDSDIKTELKKYIEQGLIIAINTDQHDSSFIESKIRQGSKEYNFKVRDKRYWIALKILEKYFNELFSQLGIKAKNILNTFSDADLDSFLKKS